MDTKESNKKIINLINKKDATANMIIPNVINHLEMNGFTYQELEAWVAEFVQAYNEMMERKNRVNYHEKLISLRKSQEEEREKITKKIEELNIEIEKYSE